MSAGRSQPRWTRGPRLAAVTVILLLVLFFVWTALQRAKSPRPFQTQPGTNIAAHTGRSSTSLVGSVVTGLPAARSTPRLPTTQRVLKYGRAEGELGMVREPGQPPVGPESFTVSKDGGILVADVVNQRVVVYSSNGTYIRSLTLPGVALGDVATDPQGRVYVYDQVGHALRQYDADGTLRRTLNLDPKDIDTRGYFHITGDAVYFADAAARDVLVATLPDGVLVAPEHSAGRRTDGIHGESGRVYSLSVDRAQGLQVEVRDTAGESVTRRLQVPVTGIVSARYVGEDQARRVYIQTERLAGANIVLEVLAFAPDGEPLATTRMPENDYAIWTAKLVDVQPAGTIVQFLPQRAQAKLNFFTN